MYKYIFILFVISISFFSCEEIENFPDTPHIEFISFSLNDSILSLDTHGKVGLLKFKFTDGDGDISYELNDTSDIFLNKYTKVNGVFLKEEVDSNFPPETYKIPKIRPVGENNPIQGEIEVKIEYPIIPKDTIKYHFYIIDQAKNKSNVDSTYAIVFY